MDITPGIQNQWGLELDEQEQGDTDKAVTPPRPGPRPAPISTPVLPQLRQDDVCRRDKRTTRHLTNPTASVSRAFSKSVGFAEAISHHEEGSREVLNWGLEQVHLPINHSLQGWRPSQAVSPLAGKGPENGIAAPSVSQVSSVSQFNAAIVLFLKAAICLQHPFLGSKAHPQEARGEHGQPECGGRVRSLVSSLSQGKRLTWRKLP